MEKRIMSKGVGVAQLTHTESVTRVCSNSSSIQGDPLKQNSAITLIALVITIIVLLILSAVTLNMILGENGIIAKAKQAAQDYKEAESDELAKLNYLNDMIINNGREETNYDSQYESLLARVVALENQYKVKKIEYDEFTVSKGDRYKVSFAPDTGYEVVCVNADFGSSWLFGKVDGDEYVIRNTNTTTDVSANLTLTIFEKKIEQ